jgi:hypothetical protein
MVPSLAIVLELGEGEVALDMVLFSSPPRWRKI